MTNSRSGGSPKAPTDFIRAMVAADVESGKDGGVVTTRFPPEPNGYLHIGHSTAICLDFQVAQEWGGTCNLRFDDTNPTTEDERFARAIEEDIRWLGFEWDGPSRYASDYFERYYQHALQLIRDGKAYVDSQSEEEIRARRGTVTSPGEPSPDRDRPIEESLDTFERMRAGEFEDGAYVLRARVDMAAPNMKMRDPLLYRIRHATHYRTGDEWPIYPMYDWAHPLGDAIEGITHSLCTLEFLPNNPLYEWVVENTRPGIETGEPGAWKPRPYQTEFARLNLDYTVMSKRKLAQLVAEGGQPGIWGVDGWDDPRMPTLSGLRRRGVTAEAIRRFCDLVGIAKADKRVDIGKLEHAVRDDLNHRAPRRMCVLKPLCLEIENYPEGKTEWLDAPDFPPDVVKEGSRKVPFSRQILIDRNDFEEDPPEGFHRLAPGREVRLKYGYLVTCNDIVRAPDGQVWKLRCTYDPESRGGTAPDGRKVPGTIHWVSYGEAVPCEVRLYDRLFAVADPEADADFHEHLNPLSLLIVEEARVEPSVADDPPGTRYQFERLGYFVRDTDSGKDGRPVYNRTVELKDPWARRRLQDELRPGGLSERPVARVEKAEGAVGEDTGRIARDQVRAAEPELASRFERYVADLGLPEEDADLLTGDLAIAGFFEAALSGAGSPRATANWVVNELLRELKDRSLEELQFGGEELGALVGLVEDGAISGPTAKDVFTRLIEEGGDPREIVRSAGLEQIADPEQLRPLVEEAIAAHPDQAARYREGQTGLFGFFVGQVMRETDGRASPEVVQKIVREQLG
jgi:glutaminyl-tRNA synthetase